MKLKMILLLMLFLVPIASATDVTTPIKFVGTTTNVTLNYSTSISNLEFDPVNDSLTLDGITHTFSSVGNMDVSLDSFFKLSHSGDSGTWVVSGMEEGNYSVYINDYFSTTIENEEPVSLTTTATYELEPEEELIYFNMTYWEPLNETCAKFTIYNIYRAWYPELSYTVADSTYFLYYDNTGTLMATNTTTNTNDTIILKTSSLLSAGNYTIIHIDSDLIGATMPEISSFSPSSTPSFSILPSGTTQRSFSINIANADSNLETKWYYGEKFFSVYGNDEDYIETYNYTLAETDSMDTTQSTHTFSTSEIGTIGIIARLSNTTTGLYEDKVWNWVIQEPDFEQTMDYSSVPIGTSNTISLTTSNEEISEVVLQYEIDGVYTNTTMTSIYSNYEYGEVINGETSYTYTEVFDVDITPAEDGTYAITRFYITQDSVVYSLLGEISFTSTEGGSTVNYNSPSSSGGSGSGSKKITDVIETLSVKDGSETFEKTDKHALYSVTSEDKAFIVTIKTDYTNLDENIYKQMDISVTNSENIPYEFTFLVDSSWMAENGEVKLMHYENGEWIEVPIEVISRTEDYVKYSATLTSFSPYAIIADDSSSTQIVSTITKDGNLYYIVGLIIIIIGIVVYLEKKGKPKTIKKMSKWIEMR